MKDSNFPGLLAVGISCAVLAGLAAVALFAPVNTESDLVFTVISPVDPVVAGRTTSLTILAINPASTARPFCPERVLSGRVSTSEGKWDVGFSVAAPRPSRIEPGAYGMCECRFTVPADTAGRAIIEIAFDSRIALRTVVEVDPCDPADCDR